MSTGEHELIAGRYRPVRQLGRGGMGVVWRAHDEVLGREVAVKELRTYTDSSGPELAELRVRMQREARAAARVRHPGVIAVHDIADHGGRPVIVMELVDGPSLADVLTARGVMDPREAARIGAEVLDALAAAHAVGVLHRDVKPGNILLDATGRVVLTDFGIAAMEDPGDGSTTHLTRSGELVGSLDYLAPERAQGQEPGPGSDVWALGATLYAAVEGMSPFRRTSTWSTLTAIVAEPLPEPRNAGPLAPVLPRLMAKDPGHRPDASTAAAFLRQVADGTGPGAPAAYVPTERTTLPPRGFGPPTPEAPGFGPPPGDGHGSGAVRGDGHGFGAPRGGQGYGGTAPGGAYPAPGGHGYGYGPADPDRPAEPSAAPGQYVQAPGPGHGHGQGPGQVGGHTVTAGHTSGGFGQPEGRGAAGPGGRTTRAQARAEARKRRPAALVAAAVAAVVLAGGGVTYALMDGEEPTGGGQALTGGEAGGAAGPVGDDGMSLAPGAGPSASADGWPRAEPRPSASGSGSAAPSKSATTPGTASGGGTGGGPETGTRSPSGGPTGAAPTEGGSSSTGGGAAEEPVCHPIGGGKYNCTVWRTANSYRSDGSQAGILNAGTNYFYCQSDLGRRETHGEWTNVWWAKTDDDSGNTGVWFSDVYIKGGANDAPVPGLPFC
ncbi:serine/threonine-protein kinase [Streptomyces thermolilacinus]|uniref:non-specific serine/threonine protein kinase n=1 Tax=Streptomyces thermolilacinus SPC6 TaxID=1306406 RepID=A0A1D3DYH5_9ACTN|nr:serine/threonine-protein kinase [Streptomyces thermolilacinus]OEJ97382.1 serine/threonine protein phosphatase [Streptomyces thermolilacinus SPC6]